MGKQSQLLLQPTEVELGLQIGVEFDNIHPDCLPGLVAHFFFIIVETLIRGKFCPSLFIQDSFVTAQSSLLVTILMSLPGLYACNLKNTSLVAKGALAHHLQCCTACNTAPPAKSKMAARGPKMVNGVWKSVYP